MKRPGLPEGRADWLARFVIPHEAALRHWLARRTGLRLEVDDVVQETYAVLAGLEDVGHVHNPRAYLFATAHSVILQHVRRAQIVPIETVAEFDHPDMPHDDLSPDRYAISRQELRWMSTLIAELPAKCREAFLLRKVEGFSQREIARRMGISENTVEKHISKGLRLLMDTVVRGEGPRPARTSAGKEKGQEHDAAVLPQKH